MIITLLLVDDYCDAIYNDIRTELLIIITMTMMTLLILGKDTDFVLVKNENDYLVIHVLQYIYTG